MPRGYAAAAAHAASCSPGYDGTAHAAASAVNAYASRSGGISDVEAASEKAAQAILLRCLFGLLPFRPVTIDPAWLAWNDGTVRKLAQAIYTERRFADLPILGDALEDAGCTNADILSHCRQPGPRPRLLGG